MIKILFVFSFLLLAFMFNVKCVYDVNNTIENTSSIQYEILNKRKYKSSSSRYEINILYDEQNYKINIDRYAYYKIDEEDIYPELFYDKKRNKIYSERDVILLKKISGLIIFIFMIFMGTVIKQKFVK